MKRFLVAVLFVLLAATVGRAQAAATPGESPTIQGDVSLPNGNPAVNIRLELEAESAGGDNMYATTDSAGFYAFQGPGLGVGNNYILHCDVQGYESIRRLVMVTSLVTQENFVLVAVAASNPAESGGIVSVQQLKVPPKARAVFQKGILQMEHQQPAEAEAAFRKAIGLYPKFAAAYMCLGAVLADQRKFPEADEAIHQAVELDGKSSNTYAYLGYIYVRENHPKLARAAFRRSIGISSDNWFAQLEMGRLLYQEGDYKVALPYLTAAHQLHSQNPPVHLMLYNDLMQLNRKAQALAELDEIIARFPNTRLATRLRKLRPALAAAAAKDQAAHP